MELVAGFDAAHDGHLGFDGIRIAQGVVAVHAAGAIADHDVWMGLVYEERVGAGLPRSFQQGQVVADVGATVFDRGVVFDLARHEHDAAAALAPGGRRGGLDVVLGQPVFYDQLAHRCGAAPVGVREFMGIEQLFEAAGLPSVEVQAVPVDDEGVRRNEVGAQPDGADESVFHAQELGS